MNKKISKNLGLGALAIACPPAYVAQMNIRDKTYETVWGKAVGTTLYTAVTMLGCWIGGGILDGIIIVEQAKANRTVTEHIEDSSKGLTISQTPAKAFNDKANLIARQSLFPLEGAVRLALGYHTIEWQTSVNGTIKKDGLEYSISAKIPGKKKFSEITEEDFFKYTRDVKLSNNSFRKFYQDIN